MLKWNLQEAEVSYKLQLKKMLFRALLTCFNSLNMMLAITLKMLIEPQVNKNSKQGNFL